MSMLFSNYMNILHMDASWMWSLAKRRQRLFIGCQPLTVIISQSLLIYDLDMVSKRLVRYLEMCSSLNSKQQLLIMIVKKKRKEIR